jgi:hypothetical protein
MQEHYWYLDFEAYQVKGKYYLKEVALLSADGEYCYNYFIRNPSSMPYRPPGATTHYQYLKHQLRWNFGDYHFNEAMDDIFKKVADDTILVKGREKVEYLKTELNNVKEIDWLPSFKYLNNCLHERCTVRHGNCCARRKVHELQFAIQKLQQLPSTTPPSSMDY